jgi:transcriptional regulator of acetoin/glycerol metabolism
VDRDEFDYARLVNALRRHAGNMSRAAADAGISRQRAYRLIQARQDLCAEDDQEKP